MEDGTSQRQSLAVIPSVDPFSSRKLSRMCDMQTDGLSMWLKTFPNFEKQADNICFDHIIITSQASGSCCSACWEAASYIQSSVFNEDQKQNHLLAEFVHAEWGIQLLGLLYFEVDINNEN